MKRYTISFTGAGKVASSFIPGFKTAGFSIKQVVSRNSDKGKRVALSAGARWSDTPRFDEDTDIIIVAVPDRILESVLGNISCHRNTIVAHTAGSCGLEIFPGHIEKKGVFYPLQTFSEGRNVDLKGVPIFIESYDPEVTAVLNELAVSLGCRPETADVERRRMLHIAAIFVSNFTNYMLTRGYQITRKEGFDPDLLRPLLTETVAKAIERGPESSQSGPAVRNDYNTIEKHVDLLSFSPELQTLYEELSRSIIDYYKKY